jgi:hypothetical protein
MTDLILRIGGIEDALSVEFYTRREKVIKFLKEDLIKVYRNNDIEYYAPVNANELGRGHLMAAVEFEDREPMYPAGGRRVTVSGFTGYTIPCLGEGNTIACGDYEVSFERMSNIPKSDAVIYYGIGDLENPDIRELNGIKEINEIDFSFNAGDSIVVAIPKDRGMVAKKDNGFGGRIEFSEKIKGANGKEITLNGMAYKIYGEFMVVKGNLKVYIE